MSFFLRIDICIKVDACSQTSVIGADLETKVNRLKSQIKDLKSKLLAVEKSSLVKKKMTGNPSQELVNPSQPIKRFKLKEKRKAFWLYSKSSSAYRHQRKTRQGLPHPKTLLKGVKKLFLYSGPCPVILSSLGQKLKSCNEIER